VKNEGRYQEMRAPKERPGKKNYEIKRWYVNVEVKRSVLKKKKERRKSQSNPDMQQNQAVLNRERKVSEGN